MTGDDASPADVWSAVGRVLEEGEPAVLATVVGVEGRSYRRPGARMLVTPDGDGVGAVTPGCVETEVQRLAANVLADGARVETYDLRDGDVWGLGVGCNGVVDVLLEPVGEDLQPAVRAGAGGDPVTVATVVASDDDRLGVGDRSVGHPDAFPGAVAREVDDAAADASSADRPRTVDIETGRGRVEVFVDRVTPPPRLVVVGTGNDVHPVVDLAKRAGFRVTVAGFRSDADPDRFPRADEVVATSPDDVVAAAGVDAESHVVVMTHNAIDDRIAVAELLDSPAPYVGLMGPAERFEELAEATPALRDADRSALYTPVGLDLGGGSPHQIAHSIVAEVLAVHNGRSGGHLGDREGFVHVRPEN